MQTSFGTVYPEARAGMVYGSIFDNRFLGPSIVAEEAIEAGLFVSAGTTNTQGKLPTSAAEVTTSGRGFAAWISSAPTYDTGAEYPIGATLEVLEAGDIWVTSSEQMAVDDPVFVVTAASGRGTVRNDADGGNATQLPGAKVKKVSGATLALVTLVLGGLGVQGAQGAQGAQGPQGA